MQSAARLQATQMFKLGDHVHERRVERKVQQSEVVVMEGRHVRASNKNSDGLKHHLQTDG